MDGGLLQPRQKIPQSAYMAGSFGVGRIRAFQRNQSFPLLVMDGNLESSANLSPRGSGARVGNNKYKVGYCGQVSLNLSAIVFDLFE